MNCRDFREIIDSYLSDELLTETNHEIIRHLDECKDCGREIEARRFVRTRLRSAVRSAPEFEVSPRFARKLRDELEKHPSEPRRSGSGFFGFGRVWIAAAAGLLLVLSVGFALLVQSGDRTELASAEPLIMASALPSNHIVNIAAKDHDVCAVKHAGEKPPVEVEKVSAEYRELAKVVKAELTGKLRDCDLIDSHSCKFGNERFSHVVMKNGGKMLSVLVTDENPDRESVEGKILRFASDKYSISRFDLNKRAVFVVSQLDNTTNAEAAEALAEPLRLYFNQPESSGVRTALLFAR